MMRHAGMLLVVLSVNPVAYAQSPTRAQLQEQIERSRAELNAKEAQFLEPSPADQQEYADLVSQPDSGLLRLLPRETFDSREKLTVNGGGAYYSFSRLTHEYGYGSDVELYNGELSVGFAGCDYGFVAKLADQPLRSITLETPGVAAIAAHEPPAAEPGAREQQRRSSTGFIADGVRYASRVPAEVGATYVLRSVNYGSSDVLVSVTDISKIPPYNGLIFLPLRLRMEGTRWTQERIRRS